VVADEEEELLVEEDGAAVRGEAVDDGAVGDAVAGDIVVEAVNAVVVAEVLGCETVAGSFHGAVGAFAVEFADAGGDGLVSED